jgi:xylulose-5-phosphate/fructose-6-phosphate phosphoketolase
MEASKEYGVQLDVAAVRKKFDSDLKKLEKLRRITNFLSGTQLYLRDNFLMKEPLNKEHLKPRILGHWGTCPGINLVYEHCNWLIKKHDLDMFIVVGPGNSLWS